MEKTRFKLLESIGWESVGRDQSSAAIVRSSQHPGQHPAPRTRSLGRNFKVVLPNFFYPIDGDTVLGHQATATSSAHRGMYPY